MKKFSAFFAVFALCAVAATVFTTGCETQSADEICVSITPSYAKLKVDQSIKLTASGGWNYRWNISDREAGSLSAYSGNEVIYTAHQAGKTVTVTVTGMGGASNSSSNTVSSSYSAQATMVVPAEEVVVPETEKKQSAGSITQPTAGDLANK